MNVADSIGASSCKGQENGDASSGSERPLKKARFAWQVKGKYHLRNDASEIAKTSTTESLDPNLAGSSGSSSSCKIVQAEQNHTLDSDHPVISDPEISVLQPSSSISTEELQYPRYFSSTDNVTYNVLGANDNSNDCCPISMVASQSLTEDHYIARWQAKQMAKGVIDNTINRVLDSWIQEDGSRFLALDVTDVINNLPGHNSIENEGILMAISAHGLQNTSNSSSSSSLDIDDLCNPTISTASETQTPSPQRSLSPLPSDDESQEPLINPCDIDNSSNDLDLPWSYSDDQKNEISDLTHFNSNDFDEEMADNHCDFLDAAVMFAIQSKGLTTLGTDYG